MADTDKDSDVSNRLEALERRIAKALDRLDRERARTNDRYARDMAELDAMQRDVAAHRRRVIDSAAARSANWRTVGDEVRVLEDKFQDWVGRLDQKFGF